MPGGRHGPAEFGRSPAAEASRRRPSGRGAAVDRAARRRRLRRSVLAGGARDAVGKTTATEAGALGNREVERNERDVER